MGPQSGAVSQRSRLDSLISRLNEIVESLEKQTVETHQAVNRLDGDIPETPVKGSAPTPARVALLGSLEDLVDRLERVNGELSHANKRLSAAA